MPIEWTRLEFVFMIIGILSCALGYLAAVQPARRKLYALIRAGLTYAMLFIRKKQSDILVDKNSSTNSIEK